MKTTLALHPRPGNTLGPGLAPGDPIFVTLDALDHVSLARAEKPAVIILRRNFWDAVRELFPDDDPEA